MNALKVFFVLAALVAAICAIETEKDLDSAEGHLGYYGGGVGYGHHGGYYGGGLYGHGLYGGYRGFGRPYGLGYRHGYGW